VGLGLPTLRNGVDAEGVAEAAFPPSAQGSHVAVVTDHIDATRAAMDVLSAGGSAADAAVVAALVVGVVSPSGSGLGGGGFAVTYRAKENQATSFDFRESAPAALAPDKLLAAKGPRRGQSIGVPGEPLGLETLHARYGKHKLSALTEIAAKIAENGFYVSRHLAEAAQRSGARMAPGSEVSAALFPNGQGAAFAAKVTRPQLAATLRTFGREGARAFYTGSLQASILASAKAAGSGMEASDLSSYQVVERIPLVREIAGKRVVTMSAPSAGGLMLLEVLGMYGGTQTSPLYAMGFGSSDYYHAIAEAMRGALADRVRLAGDPSFETGIDEAYGKALEPAQLAARKQRIEPTKTHQSPEFKTREGGTSHIVVVDNDGNAVALTTTVNSAFGSGIAVNGAGFLLNDELDDFSGPDEVAGFGVVGLGPNRPRPKARPVSSMTPTIVVGPQGVELVVGGSGGPRIATGVAQATLCRMVFGLDPTACVSAPRIHVSGGVGILLEREIPIDTKKALEAKGEQATLESGPPTGIHMIAIERTPPKTMQGEAPGKRSEKDETAQPIRILAAGDPRKGGFASAR
jgi:gamma-glutamyltranspeptidase / glutathione hydrolase